VKPTVTQVKSLALIKYAEDRGWKVERFESREKSFFKKQPRFTLYLVRAEFLTYYSIHLFIGAGRVSGVARMMGVGKDYESKIGNWSEAQSAAFSFGIPTGEDRRRLGLPPKTQENQQ